MTDPDPAIAATDTPGSADAATLAEFQRKAGPIVAQQRGLTPAARLKLADVARQLGIGDDQLEAALRSLGPASSAAAQNKAAGKFRRRLLKDLQPKAGGILGPKHEVQILASAREKYSLDDATALEMLASVTTELGIHRVRGDEAMRNLSDAVQDAVGDHTWIEQNTRDHLHAAGREWGLSRATIDTYIEEHLEANRTFAARSVKLNRAIYATVALLAVFVVIALSVLISGRDAEPSTSPVETTEAPIDGDKTAKPNEPPKWWTVDQALAIDQARKDVDGFPALLPDLTADDSSRRASAYHRLVGLVARVPPDPQDLATIGTILQHAYAAEPDDPAAIAIGESLLSHLPRTDSPLPRHSAAYDLAYWSAETAVAAASNPKTSAPRRTELLSALSTAIAEPLPPHLLPADQLKKALAGLTRSALRHLTAHASTNPSEAAALHPGLHAHALRHLEPAELQRFNAEFLLAALAGEAEDAAQPDLAAIRPIVLDLAASTDPQVTIALVELYERMQPSPLRDELQSLLLLRLKVTNTPQNPRAIARALRRALGVTPTGSQAVEQRWELLRSRASEVFDREPPAAEDIVRQLTDSVELAWLATQALALAQGEAGVPIYEELTALYPDEPFALKASEDADPPLPAPVSGGIGLSPNEQQTFSRYLALLGDRSSNPIQRESSLRGLAQLAPKLDDLRPSHARQLASYLLQPKPENEQAESVAAAAALRRWKQLRLAIADSLGSSALSPDQQAAIVEALLSQPNLEANSADWPRLLLESVLSDLPLPGTASQTVRAEHRQALEVAAEGLSEVYRIRARLLGASPAEYQAATLPSQVLEACARQMTAQVATLRPAQSPAATADFTGWPVELVDRWPKELTLVDYLANSDIARTVLLEELALKLSAASLMDERPERSQAVLQLIERSRSNQATAKTAVEQLRAGEADLLSIWLLLSPSEE